MDYVKLDTTDSIPIEKTPLEVTISKLLPF